jgi:hypothetical protein
MLTLIKQLELNLWSEIEAAANEPEKVNLTELCQKLDQVLEQVPDNQQLAIAGNAIAEIADIYQRRARFLLDSLERQDIQQGPVLSEDFLSGLLRESMSVDLTDMMEDLEIPKLHVQRSPVHSVAGEADKAALLSMVDDLERELNEEELTQQVQALAHDEPIGEWVEMIREFLSQQPDPVVSFPEIVSGLKIPCVAVWLGLLHGGESWQMSQAGEFYEAGAIQIRG